MFDWGAALVAALPLVCDAQTTGPGSSQASRLSRRDQGRPRRRKQQQSSQPSTRDRLRDVSTS